jgi:hypothetical protein
MLFVFSNGTGKFLIDILPESMKIDTDYFAYNITDEISRLCYPQGKRSRERRVMLHFDSAQIHCTGTVWDRMAAAELERMEHPPYSPDLTPCDFFFFRYVKGKLVGKQYETPDDFVSEVEILLRASAWTFCKVSSNPGRKIAGLLDCWIAGLLDCWIAGILVVNMWNKLYILVLRCLSNFARVRRVRVNNEHP